jgi:hypothetical protein
VGLGLVALLLVLGVGAFAVIHFMGNNAISSQPKADPSNPAGGAGGAEATAGGHEIGRYWLEVDSKQAAHDIRAGNPVVMESGQSFKLHFSPSENGYLYIIGPGTENAPTTFLTAKPGSDSGLKTNEAKSGLDFAFPVNGATKEHWITLDTTAGTDEFTIIFSPTPLETPKFLGAPAGHELTQDEQKELSDLREQSRANSVGTEVIKTGAAPSVSVKVPQSGAEGAPVIFKLRIEHQ